MSCLLKFARMMSLDLLNSWAVSDIWHTIYYLSPSLLVDFALLEIFSKEIELVVCILVEALTSIHGTTLLYFI